MAFLPKLEGAQATGKQEQEGPRKEGNQKNRSVEPERLDVLEFRGEEALEIVLDDEDTKKIGIASGAQDVPGKGGEAETGDGQRVKAPESVAPALGEGCPKQNAAAGQNER